MPQSQQPRLRTAYLSFDVVPAPKGAAIHIEAFVRALGESGHSVELVTVSPTPVAMRSRRDHLWPGVTHSVLPAIGKTLIDRVLHFKGHLQRWLQAQVSEQRFDVIQVRSIFEGYAIAQNKAQFCDAFIFEVNGLPSIELKYRYPKVADDPELMNKLLIQEQVCIDAADVIVTPSAVTRDHLLSRGISPAKIQVIPNGVDLSVMTYQPPRTDTVLTTLNMLYFGTLSAWQGVDLAIDALSLYRRDFDARLKIVGPARGKQVEQLRKLAHKLGVTDAVEILEPVDQPTLVTLMHGADVMVAPLKANDRNIVQGCCPLKVIEGMASGTPVITSDLPVVLALGEAEKHFLAVRPGSAKAIKDGMLRLRDGAPLRLRLSREGRSHVEQHYTWQRSCEALLAVYRQLQPATITTFP